MTQPGVRGSYNPQKKELNFVDIILAVGITPLANFLKGRKTAAGAVAALLAYATPLREIAVGTGFEEVMNFTVAMLELLAVWLGGGGLVSWLLAARKAGSLLRN